MKKLTENDVLMLGTPINGTKMTYLVINLRYIRNYQLQKCVQANDELLKAEATKIMKAMDATYGNDWRKNPQAKADLENESSVKLEKVEITEEQMNEYNPNWDALNCLEFIRK